MNKLMDGSYYIYQIADGGCGIVKADCEANAVFAVGSAYRKHGQELDLEDIECFKISDYGETFDDSPNVVEIGWNIDLNV